MASPAVLYQAGDHASRPANGSGCVLYSCTDHDLVYRDDGTSWTTFMTLVGGSGGDIATDTIWDAAGDLVQGTGANAGAKLSAGTAGQVLTSAGAAAANVWGPGPKVVQVVTANSTADDATTAATLQDSSLSLAITPLFSDSILHIEVDGECQVSRAAGTLVERYLFVAIRNHTNSVDLVSQVRGMRLAAASDQLGTWFGPIAVKARYTVNSTAARTFKLQFMAGIVTNLNATLTGSRTGGITMTISEVRP